MFGDGETKFVASSDRWYSENCMRVLSTGQTRTKKFTPKFIRYIARLWISLLQNVLNFKTFPNHQGTGIPCLLNEPV